MIKIYRDLIQGSDEWHAARCGMLTASEMKLIMTPMLKPASNDKERQHLYELLAQRITRYVEPSYVSPDMLRGIEDENEALSEYQQRHGLTLEHVGFVTNDKWGFSVGFSPDAFVGDDGFIEVKSRRQKYQIETFLLHYAEGTIPADYLLQVQTGFAVTERKWCDFLSYSGGLPTAEIRVYPEDAVIAAIQRATEEFEMRLEKAWARYLDMTNGLKPTERRVEQEMYVS